jgi:hypothetical protein
MDGWMDEWMSGWIYSQNNAILAYEFLIFFFSKTSSISGRALMLLIFLSPFQGQQ